MSSSCIVALNVRGGGVIWLLVRLLVLVIVLLLLDGACNVHESCRGFASQIFRNN